MMLWWSWRSFSGHHLTYGKSHTRDNGLIWLELEIYEQDWRLKEGSGLFTAGFSLLCAQALLGTLHVQANQEQAFRNGVLPVTQALKQEAPMLSLSLCAMRLKVYLTPWLPAPDPWKGRATVVLEGTVSTALWCLSSCSPLCSRLCCHYKTSQWWDCGCDKRSAYLMYQGCCSIFTYPPFCFICLLLSYLVRFVSRLRYARENSKGSLMYNFFSKCSSTFSEMLDISVI